MATASRGGRLTSLDASFARCFAFWRTSSKTSRLMFFQKHRPNIASLRKKHDVFHDVFSFGSTIKSHDKSLIIQEGINFGFSLKQVSIGSIMINGLGWFRVLKLIRMCDEIFNMYVDLVGVSDPIREGILPKDFVFASIFQAMSYQAWESHPVRLNKGWLGEKEVCEHQVEGAAIEERVELLRLERKVFEMSRKSLVPASQERVPWILL